MDSLNAREVPMENPSSPLSIDRTLAFLPPVWTRLPTSDRVGVAAVVLAGAFAALIIGVRVRQALDRPAKRRSRVRDEERSDASWFTADSLDGFPEDAVRARLKGPDAPSLDRLHAAWVLARHARGISAEWLERNLDLPADAAHLIVEASEATRVEPDKLQSESENRAVPRAEGDDGRSRRRRSSPARVKNTSRKCPTALWPRQDGWPSDAHEPVLNG
ncbi:hypothetical protein ACF1GY_24375 [Streptomyces sp. NPDC014684]|uniref:hypothetical protein n=1 Tax=Streptomyces sp. NPDC014684 TaxID=3364880 RepID=UPI0037015E21